MNDNTFFISESSDDEDDIEIKRNKSFVEQRKYQAFEDFSADMFESESKQNTKSFVLPQNDFEKINADEIQTINDHNKSVI